jgi:hypothetical protein
VPYLSEVREFLTWLVEVFGALQSVLICMIVYLAYQLREEQKETRGLREQHSAALEKSVEVQARFVKALVEARAAVEAALKGKHHGEDGNKSA